MYSVHRCFQLICRWLIRSLVYFPPWLPSILDSGLAWNLIIWKAHGAFKLSIRMLWFPIEYMHWLPYLLCAQLDKVHQTFLSNPCSACISRVVTISFSYAYHNRTYPTFSLRTLDITMTSWWHHYDTTNLWPHSYITMTSSLHHYSTMTSSTEHYKYSTISWL